jgi:hypothetical protein
VDEIKTKLVGGKGKKRAKEKRKAQESPNYA